MDDLRELIDEHLPGRTAAEDEALKHSIDEVRSAAAAMEAARSKVGDTSLSLAVREKRLERYSEAIPGLRATLDAAKSAVKAKCHELADERRRLLPADASDISVGGGGDDHSAHRWKVTCRTGAGERVNLGACVGSGNAHARCAWYLRVLEERGATAGTPSDA